MLKLYVLIKSSGLEYGPGDFCGTGKDGFLCYYKIRLYWEVIEYSGTAIMKFDIEKKLYITFNTYISPIGQNKQVFL